VQRSPQSNSSGPQNGWQVPARHVSVGAQAWPHAPQSDELVVGLTHVPLQFVRPGAHVAVQAPLTQTWPVAQAWLHPPQFVTLLFRSMQLRAHCAYPIGQLADTQAPFWQSSPGLHAVPQVPQWLAFVVRSVQTPSQLASPGQVSVQVPLEHAVGGGPAGQTCRTSPQLLESEARLSQAVVGPWAEKNWPGTRDPAQLVVHSPFTQTCPAGQAFPQLPQCRLEVCSVMQRPLHWVMVAGQEAVQVPPTQTSPEAHAVPQVPQCRGLLYRSTQPVLHSVRPFAQVPVSGKSM